MTRLLIAGATGLVGHLVLERAIADERVTRIVALARRPIEPHEKLDTIITDLPGLPEHAAWWAVDGVISALGTTRAQTASPSAYRAVDHDYPLAIARRARDHGATAFALASSLGADPRSLFTYTRTKGELERELGTLGYPSLTIVRPSVLGGRQEQKRIDERMANVILRLLGPALPRRWRVSQADAVAATLLDAVIDARPGFHIRHNEDLIEAI